MFCQDLPVTCYFMMPSCVPATDMATSGARLGAMDVAAMLATTCAGNVRAALLDATSWERTTGKAAPASVQSELLALL